MKLTPAVERYVLHWGEMGTRWGVNRSVAQIHALLYLSPKAAWPAEEIAETLSIARSNVSNSLKRTAKLGPHCGGPTCWATGATISRRWKIPGKCSSLIVEGRKRREIDPTLKMLRDCVQRGREATVRPSPEVKARIENHADLHRAP